MLNDIGHTTTWCSGGTAGKLCQPMERILSLGAAWAGYASQRDATRLLACKIISVGKTTAVVRDDAQTGVVEQKGDAIGNGPQTG